MSLYQQDYRDILWSQQTVAQKHTSSDHLWFRPCMAPSRLEQGYSTVPAGTGHGEAHGKDNKTYGSHDDIIGLSEVKERRIILTQYETARIISRSWVKT
jgi:hypothetical protein